MVQLIRKNSCFYKTLFSLIIRTSSHSSISNEQKLFSLFAPTVEKVNLVS